MKDYHINIFWSDEDGSYVADITDLVLPETLGSSVAQREYPRAPAPLVYAHECSTFEVAGILRKGIANEGTEVLRCNVTRSQLHHARGGGSRHRENRSEVEVMGEQHVAVGPRPAQDRRIGCSDVADQ